MDLAPEQRIGPDLVLVRPLGEGGMASVWVAHDLMRGHRVAVKVIRPELMGNAEAVERFTSEAAAMARIQSPFVPRIYERGSLPDGTPFISMELLEGADLDAHLRTHGRLSLATTATVVAQIGAALEAAHRMGIVHRDVKPENIFIRARGGERGAEIEAKLFDFGIAKIPFEARRTHMGALLGTPGYMSPEQLLSTKNVDPRADFWSLAVVAYVALTGKLPFDGETFGAVCIAIHHAVYDLPSRLFPDLPSELDEWFAKALDPDLEARFQSAREMSASLEALALRHGHMAESHPSRRLLDESVDAPARPSMGGVSSTRRTLRKAARGKYFAFAAVFAACALYSASDARVMSWIPRHAGMAWTATAKLATATLGTPRGATPTSHSSAVVASSVSTASVSTTSSLPFPAKTDESPSSGASPMATTNVAVTALVAPLETEAKPAAPHRHAKPIRQETPSAPAPVPSTVTSPAREPDPAADAGTGNLGIPEGATNRVDVAPSEDNRDAGEAASWPPPGRLPDGFGSTRD
jgi:serine/threonine protein kinase